MQSRISVVLFAVLICCLNIDYISAKDLTVVIDAGHGGKDPGAVGNTFLEKNINLKVAQLLGKRIKENYPDVKVVYTRNSDVYVTLQDRAAIANRANGDLFISIHTNASESHNAVGTETFTLGLAKTNANFEVAKRENSVMLLENDKEVYQGFDPTSPDSYIMFELMQSTYIDLSILMADYVQTEFTSTGRSDRGVRQAGFWVLHQVKMPSVLIELGFITNTAEERYIGSAEGATKLANCIYSAFSKFKHEYDRKSVNPDNKNKDGKENKPAEEKSQGTTTDNKTTDNKNTTTNAATNTANETYYAVQCFAVTSQVDKSDSDYKRASKFGEVSFRKIGKYFKYHVGHCKTMDEARELLTRVQTVFKTAFIVTIEPEK